MSPPQFMPTFYDPIPPSPDSLVFPSQGPLRTRTNSTSSLKPAVPTRVPRKRSLTLTLGPASYPSSRSSSSEDFNSLLFPLVVTQRSTNPEASTSSGPQAQDITAKSTSTNNFVMKLYDMVNDEKSQNLVSWTELGTSFVVSNVGEFSRNILGSHFKHNNFSSFVRQLNMYGFHKINRTPRAQRTASSPQTWEFSHPKFLRGRLDLLDAIKRKALEPDPRERSRIELPGEVARLLSDLREENNAIRREIRSLSSSGHKHRLLSSTLGHPSPRSLPNLVGSSCDRCLTCSPCSHPNVTSRNLVVCIDGTANKFGRNNTNVVKLFEGIDCDTKYPLPEQYTYYSSGIGTRPRILHVFKRMQRAISDRFDMAVAWNMEEIVKDAYAWLAGKFQEGDQIYLFGFSRGAYQVRILAGMIYEVGLIKNPTEKQIGTAYDHFESILSHRPNANDMAREFRRAFSWKDVRAHFIGVWDTVSSVGFGRRDVCLSASSSAVHACHIRHALALDECRVKFMPEYFLEMNSPNLHGPTQHTKLKAGGMVANSDVEGESRRVDRLERIAADQDVLTNEKSSDPSDDDIVLEPRIKPQPIVTNATACAEPNDECTNWKTSNIKEVWFPGSHSDVGGKHRPGKSFHAGNISLTWMRREASKCGLMVKAEDILWTDEDLDFGTTNSMSLLWKLVEIFPLRHQVTFSGPGANTRRPHLFEPRRIIPGQKIHASVQFANTYIPKATFGNGFGNPLETAGPMPSKEDDVWEKDILDHASCIALFNNLAKSQGTAPFYLHRLLFALRFTEGHWPIKDMSDQRKILIELITKQSGLVRLVSIITYFEIADSSVETSFSEEIFAGARQSLVSLIKPDQPDWPRVVTLLRPIAKHKNLRTAILTDEVISGFLHLLDHVTLAPGEHFARVMDALTSVVEFHPVPIINRLVEPPDGMSQKERLSLMLDTNDPRHLTAVLQVIITLAKKAPFLCDNVKPRLLKLAGRRKGAVSVLAVRALVGHMPKEEDNDKSAEVAKDEAEDLGQVSQNDDLNRRNSVAAASYASHVSYLHAESAIIAPARKWKRTGDSLVHQIFPVGFFQRDHKKFIKKLLVAANGRHTRARTASTFTLLKLCEVDDSEMQVYLLDKGILKVFVRQLQFKDSALLAAYALTKILKYRQFSTRVKDDQFVGGYLINMIRLDYFDEAIGAVEGFTIFEELLKCSELRSKILRYNLTTLLESKLGTSEPREMRTTLIYLNILRNYGHSLTQNLVERGLIHLKTNRWSIQKLGVAILCSLAQTWFGVEALKQIIPEVVTMLLPRNDGGDHQAGPPSWNRSKFLSALFGPAFAVRVLAENETLREMIRGTEEYSRLKHLYLFGDLLGATETPVWRVETPTRDDVLEVINQMIKSVDSVEGSTNGGFILPHIRHWDRIVSVLRDGVVDATVVPSAVAGVGVLTIVGGIFVAPLLVLRKVSEVASLPWHIHQQNGIIRNLRMPESESSIHDDLLHSTSVVH